MRYRIRAFLRLWRWRSDLSWRRALIVDTLRGRLEQRAVSSRLIRLEKPVWPSHRIATAMEIRQDDYPA
jgi:hypothetical protein